MRILLVEDDLKIASFVEKGRPRGKSWKISGLQSKRNIAHPVAAAKDKIL
jgi:hypothetical protein